MFNLVNLQTFRKQWYFDARTSVAHLNSALVYQHSQSLIRNSPLLPNGMPLACFPTLGIPAIMVAIILSVKKDLYGTLSSTTPL